VKTKTILAVLFLSFFTFTSENVKGQANNKNYISASINYPIPIGDNFLKTAPPGSYMGIASVEVGVNHLIASKTYLGINVESGYLYLKSDDIYSQILQYSFDVNHYFVVKKFSIVPQINVGYSRWRFYSEDGPSKVSYYATRDGISISPSLRFTYPLTSKIELYADGRYDYSRVDTKNLANISYNRDLQLFYSGIGLNVTL
jgi:hypothetical protein